ncbi:MAG TPA: hypothetical protein VL551_08650 [Actinospica sp.]|jgi:hypothetical protein|nr:hypothetical protein [Actinospica sp.]
MTVRSLVEVRAVGGVDAGRIWSLSMGTHTLGPAPDSAILLRGAHVRRPGVRLTVTASGEAWLAIPDPRAGNDALPPEPGAPTLRTCHPADVAGTPWALPEQASGSAWEFRWPEGAQLAIYGTRLSLTGSAPPRSTAAEPVSELARVERDVLLEAAMRRADTPDPAALAADVFTGRTAVGLRKPGSRGYLRFRVGSMEGTSRTEPWIIPGLPCGVDLAEVGVLGVSGGPDTVRALARWLVVQAATHCAPEGLGIRVFADPSAGRSWEWATRLPHFEGSGADPLSIGRGIAELAARVASPGRERKAVLAVFDRASMLHEVDGVAEILGRGPEAGVYALCLDTIGTTVAECRSVMRCSTAELVVQNRAGITPDLVTAEWCSRVAAELG